ncbi:DUF748 domain-containing protein [uncultured Methylibium sp.]|uniref:DUF748 domain-containing protein n=1 Tax=uncultured Methylibium sp. TaxID=381093 RepID=UPI0025CE02A0|nr:DUF748 domain-containing protein [uncultured Methylibium sp.]
MQSLASRLAAPAAAVPRWLRRSLAVLVGMALLWTVVGGWWLPRFLQPRIEAAASEALGAPLKLGRIEIAPWKLEAGVLDLQLGPADAPWLRVAELRADVSTASLWRLAPVLERVLVREPQIRLERLATDRYNVTPMLEALARRPAQPKGDDEPARFAVYNIRVEDGLIQLADRVTSTEHRIESLRVGVPFVSNLPSQVAIDVEPLVDAVVNGSRLHVQGKAQPFHEGQRSTIAVDWQQIDVPRWVGALAPLLSQRLPVDVGGGQLDLTLNIAFEQLPSPAPPRLRISGDLGLSQLQVRLPDQGIALALDRLAVQGLDLQPLERSVTAATLQLQAPKVEIDLPRLLAKPPASGTDRLALSAPVAAASAASAPRTAAEAAPKAWQWRVGQVDLAEGQVSLRDPAWPQGQLVSPITVGLTGLDGAVDAPPATLALALADAHGARLQVDGQLVPGTQDARLKVDAANLKPLPWLAPWQSLLPVQLIDASVSARAEADIGAHGWAISDAALQLTGLQLQPAGSKVDRGKAAADRLVLPQLAVAGLQVQGRRGEPIVAQLASLTLEGLNLKATRDERGAIAWAPPAAPRSEAPAAAGDGGPPPRWQIGELRCGGCALSFSDRSVTPPAAFGVARTDLSLRKLDSDLAQTLSFELATQVLNGGRIKAGGTLRPQPLALRSRLDVSALDLRMLQPYLEPRVNLSLVSAKASAAGELRLEGTARDAVSAVRWRGRVALNEVRALDQLNQAEFLRFKGLQLDAADLGWQPSGLEADLGEVTLDDFYGRVIVNADGRLNLLDIAKRAGEEGPRSLTTPEAGGAGQAPASSPSPSPSPPPTQAAASAPDPAASGPAPAAPPPQLRWRAIRLAGGVVDFTDNFIRPNYSAKLTDIGGEVSALAWNDPQPATVKISGKVDGSAPLEIGGSMHPLGPRLATDITASARGIDITRLTAYSGRYAGYGIEKGTLSVKVRYKIENGKLEAENNLYLDQLTFGDKVDSPSALKLPVLLAVSLLKDRNGVIDIDLPISGSLDDPKFSIGGIIVRVIVNLITKAITAPFSLLASAFGGGGQELGYVEFAAGSSDLGDASRQRLDTLAKALNDRPALKLEATGRADPAVDEAALRAQHLDRLMRVAKARSTGELPDSVKIEPAERSRWLEAAYKAADLKEKPRNLVGFAKSLPPAEMEALLLKSAPVGEGPLRALADQRGDRVKAYLAAKVPPERVLLTASRLGAEGIEDKGGSARVGFALK